MAQKNGFLAIDLAADLAKMTQTITDLAAASPDSAAKATTSSYTSTLPTSPLLRVIFLDIDGVLNRTKEATHIRLTKTVFSGSKLSLNTPMPRSCYPRSGGILTST